jgi:hypothetical protein
MEEVEVIQSLTSCTFDEARHAFSVYKTVIDAVDSLLPKPVKPADKYIPEKPATVPHMDAEQAARCADGRKLMDALTVTSVYHPKIQPAQSVEEVGMQALRLRHDAISPSGPAVLCQEELDSPEQTAQLPPQSETPP